MSEIFSNKKMMLWKCTELILPCMLNLIGVIALISVREGTMKRTKLGGEGVCAYFEVIKGYLTILDGILKI